MSKLNLLLISLIAAVPGAILLVLMALSFVNYGEKSSGALKGLAAFTALLALVVTASPVLAWMFGAPGVPRPAKKPDEPAKDDDFSGDDEAAPTRENDLSDESTGEGDTFDLDDDVSSAATDDELEIADDDFDTDPDDKKRR